MRKVLPLQELERRDRPRRQPPARALHEPRAARRTREQPRDQERAQHDQRSGEHHERADERESPGHDRSRCTTRTGAPVGDRALEDPPRFTLGPNPAATAFARASHDAPGDARHRAARPRSAPFAADVRTARSDAASVAHGYHTKIPPRAIVRYLLHYTRPGELVYDGFCGSGMTGVAALACAAPDDALRGEIAREWRRARRTAPAWGARRAFLCDLSPAATFIAASYARAVGDADPAARARDAAAIADAVEREVGALYETDAGGGRRGRVLYTIWSDVFACPRCGADVVLWHAAVDARAGRMRAQFACDGCGAGLTRRELGRAWDDVRDAALGRVARRARAVPIAIVYELDGRRREKTPDAHDLERIARAHAALAALAPGAFPTARIPDGDKTGDLRTAGITHVHQLYTERNLVALAALWSRARAAGLAWLVTGILPRASKQHQVAISRVGGARAREGGKTAGHRRGTLYVPSIQVEHNPIELFRERARAAARLAHPGARREDVCIETCSAARSSLPDASVDYVFVDPPFGANLQYAELNFAWEAWLGIATAREAEAVVNRTRGRTLDDYRGMLEACFRDFHRVLKPGRFMTVVFHNSERAVWNALAAALRAAGFRVRAVHVLDKGARTHTQRTATATVEKDLVISAVKADGASVIADAASARADIASAMAEDEAAAWRFVARRLATLPRASDERRAQLLYDRMIAHQLRLGRAVPLDAPAFYAGLRTRFRERKARWFPSA
jgi:DNA methylase